MLVSGLARDLWLGSDILLVPHWNRRKTVELEVASYGTLKLASPHGVQY